MFLDTGLVRRKRTPFSPRPRMAGAAPASRAAGPAARRIPDSGYGLPPISSRSGPGLRAGPSFVTAVMRSLPTGRAKKARELTNPDSPRQCAASYSATMFAGMRPRSLTLYPRCFAHCLI
jgi:hypothetical protein